MSKTNYQAGKAAEICVEKIYRDRGAATVASRWRGQRGELDLVMTEGSQIVFVEVKKSKTHAQAATRLGPGQIKRIFVTAEEYLAREELPMSTEMRFDVALVDQNGAIDILENALAA